MLLEISDIGSWKNFFDVIYDSSNVIELRLNPSKCKISLLNNSHVAFYDVEYDKSFFNTYQVEDFESVIIDVDDFYKILKSATKNDTMTLESTDTGLKIVFENDTNRRVFELPLEADYDQSPVPPSIDYDGCFSVLLDDLKAPCNDLDKIVKTDKFTMNIHDGLLRITSPKDSMTKYLEEINVDSEVMGSVTVNISYISELLKLSKINKMVEFRIGDGIPLSWNVTSPFEDVKVSGLIAPIIEQDD